MKSLFLENRAGKRIEIWPARSQLEPGLIQENEPYKLEAFGISCPRSTELFIGTEQLEGLMPRQDETCLWKWEPGFYAGSVEIRVVESGGKNTTIPLILDPDINKLSRHDFAVMLQEIMEDSLALFRLGSFKVGIAHDKQSKPPEIARLEYISQKADDLEEVLLKINRKPKRVLHGIRSTTRLGSPVRVTGNDVLRSYRGSNLVKTSSSRFNLPKSLNGLLPEKIQYENKVQLTDIKENREILFCLKLWNRWLSNADSALLKAERASSRREGPAESGTKYQYWRLRVKKIRRKINRLTNLEFLHDVSHINSAPKLSSIYKRDPDYRKFFQLYKEFNYGLARVTGDFLDLPLSRTFDLYEYWCFFRLLRVFIKKYGVDTGDLDSVFSDTQASDIRLKNGAIRLRLKNGYTLGFKRQFKEYWLENDGLGSFSRTMEPDIYIELCRPDNTSRLIVLDAKYRIKTNLNEAIASIHMYRDSIVRELSSGIRSEVVGAYLISPHVPEVEEEWKDTPVPSRFFHPEYRGKFKFGILTLRPGTPLSAVEQSITEVFNDSNIF